MTYTFVIMELSKAAYDEIRAKLEEAGYDHAVHDDGTLDMHGIGVRPEDPWEGPKYRKEKPADRAVVVSDGGERNFVPHHIGPALDYWLQEVDDTPFSDAPAEEVEHSVITNDLDSAEGSADALMSEASRFMQSLPGDDEE